jgi:hypothetical protein
MMTTSLCTSGHRCVPEVLSRMRKPERERVRARIDHMELSYDGMIRIIMYSYIYIALHTFQLLSTVLHDVMF